MFSASSCFLLQSQLIAGLFVVHNLISTTDVECDMRWGVCMKEGRGHFNHVYLSGRGVEISEETSFNSMLN